MSDRITRRAMVASTLAHAALVVLAVWGGRLAPPPPDAAPADPPPPPPATELVLAPEIAPTAPPPDLPALGQADAPGLPPLPITREGPTDLPGLHDSAGSSQSAPAYRSEDLPLSAGRDDGLASELRAKHASETLTHEAEMQRDAASIIGGKLRQHLRGDRDWRSFADRATRRDLVLQVEVDARCHITRVAMVQGTGIEEFDRRIVSWVEHADFFLPPIPVNRPLFPSVSLR